MITLLFFFFPIIVFCGMPIPAISAPSQENTPKIYTFSALSLQGDTVNFSQYQGKILLIVNTASKCGLTPQYKELQMLYEKYKDKGLVVLGFPCNQFLKQEPGTAEEIQEFCTANYGVTFPMFEKIEVNGNKAHPLFQYLKQQLPIEKNKTDISWNFTKFLIDSKGQPVSRFEPRTTPASIESSIVSLLPSVK